MDISSTLEKRKEMRKNIKCSTFEKVRCMREPMQIQNHLARLSRLLSKPTGSVVAVTGKAAAHISVPYITGLLPPGR